MSRPKKFTDNNTSAQQPIKEEVSVQDLMKQIEDLRMLLQSTKNSSNNTNNIGTTETKQEYKKEDEDFDDDDFSSVEIPPDKYIKIISLYPSVLNLTTQTKGRGKLFSFKKFGEVKRVMYSDLVMIMENHSEYTDFLREGYYYIADKSVIRKNGLTDLYMKILTEEKIKKIINCDPNEAIDLFKSANKTQQSIIADLIIQKLVAGEDLDLNIVDALSRISGIKIQERVQEIKEYESLPK